LLHIDYLLQQGDIEQSTKALDGLISYFEYDCPIEQNEDLKAQILLRKALQLQGAQQTDEAIETFEYCINNLKAPQMNFFATASLALLKSCVTDWRADRLDQFVQILKEKAETASKSHIVQYLMELFGAIQCKHNDELYLAK
jgi:hypothetical protein